MHRHRSLRLVVALLAVTVVLSAVSVSAATEVVDTHRISLAPGGGPANGESFDPAMSADGSIIVFNSYAGNLVSGDTNGVSDVFMYEVASGTTTRISMAPGPGAVQANDDSGNAVVSADGSVIVFSSEATNLVADDTNTCPAIRVDECSDIFVYDVMTGETTRISVPDAGGEADDASYEPSISADGTVIAYTSYATNLVAGDTNDHFDAFMYNAVTKETTRISVTDAGVETDHGGEQVAVSSDGSTIAYRSYSTNLIPGDLNDLFDIFAYDVATSTTTLVSVASNGTQANNDNEHPSVTADGSTIVYSSFASNLVSGDTNANSDIFAYDMATKETVRISVADDGSEANSDSYDPFISADGATISYDTLASNLVDGDTNGKWDILAYDVASATTTRASEAADGTQANGDSYDSALSADGFTVAYYSNATNLDAGDTNGEADIFVTMLDEAPIVAPPTNTFIDDDDSIFEQDIEWMAAEGITLGCNPPVNDRFCPDGVVTRGQMAAFLVRALDLTEQLDDPFVDDDDSIFEADIEKLAAAKITLGCNPPVNDRFCPDGKVTREQMAAFLVRALDYTDDGGGDLFIDDDDSIFEGDIDRLGTAGVTRGCNPPVNDRFCPTANVSRGQMAAFLHRALG